MSTKPIINTRADLDAIRSSDPAAHADFIAGLKGSLNATADVQVYPEGYDHALKEGDAGYLAPQLGEVPDDTIAARFGFTRAELLAL